MSSEVNRSLMELLGLLSEATKRITDILRGMPSAPRAYAAAPASPETEPFLPASAPAIPAASAVDRIQDSAPDAPDAPATEEAPRKRGRRSRLNITEAELKRLYVDERKTARQIGEIFGVAAGTVAQRVVKFGLSRRGRTHS